MELPPKSYTLKGANLRERIYRWRLRVDFGVFDRRPNFPREQIERNRSGAERLFFERLETIARHDKDTDDYGRTSCREALSAIGELLLSRGAAGPLMNPFWRLIEALDEVGEGRLPELFDPQIDKKMSEGRAKRPRSRAVKEIHLYAAALMGALMKLGTPHRQAMSKVTEAIRNWPRLGSSMLKRYTVANWRDEFIQEAASDRRRREYETLVKDFTEGPRAKEYLEEVLRDGPPLTGGRRRPTS